MSFLAPWFLIGMAAAAGPTLIHLLNRRRHRTVQWAAMDFLREAVRRNKKLIELRDLLLLLLRTLAVALFVLALAQPYWVAGDAAAFTGKEPIHAVIVIDNSLSMGYVELDKSLLDIAKEKASDLIQRLPKGSEVSIIPLCGYEQWHARDVDSTQEDALDTLARINVADRAARAADGAELAVEAAAHASHIPTKRVVFLSDMQRSTWSPDRMRQPLQTLRDVQVMKVSPTEQRQPSNAWVAQFQLLDGVADAQADAVFVATIRHLGEASQSRALVQLRIDGDVRASRHIDLEDGAVRRVIFRHRFERAGTSSDPLFARARVELDVKEPLALDNFREVIVPVVEQVPALFIDQHGGREQPRIGLYGETFWLRRLLAPPADEAAGEGESLVTVRRRAADEVTRDDLKDARLVVIAGVRAPGDELVTLLRQYVEQGGQLMIAAGAEFDPVDWHAAAWRDGAGILPAPLSPSPIGRVPPVTATADEQFERFGLNPDSIRPEAINLAIDDAAQRDLLTAPAFYKAVVAEVDDPEAFRQAQRKRITERRRWLRQFETNEREWARLERAGSLSPEDAQRRDRDRAERDAMFPNWITWANPLAFEERGYSVDELADRTRPRVLGEYDNGHPFILRRYVGKGRILMLTSGVYPQWNDIAAIDSVLIFDFLLRDMLMRSLPSRSFDAVNVINVPIASTDQAVSFTVTPPGEGEPQAMRVDPFGDDVYGIRLTDLGRRGTYEVRKEGVEAPWMVVAVNGPSDESELASFEEGEFFDRFDDEVVRWISVGEELSLEGDTYIGHNVWKLLMWLVIICLLTEMAFLAAPYLTRRGDEGEAARKGGSP